ncbi:Hypothetical protein CINCED_3A016100 [Cinara cedri]|uniref:Uncharacterized protein n=1 Tax=Cinara cedri TaxID=506608 RepID=A0A5E4NSR0_9HEMI|nr:Hypothetical protein CINCED_3A016100 [Cinara cedri]
MAEYLTRTCGEPLWINSNCNHHQQPTTTVTCADRDFDKFEFRGGQLIVGCKCTRHDGMQHECRRTGCMGQPQCLTYPVATCGPSNPCSRPDVGAKAKKSPPLLPTAANKPLHERKVATKKSAVPIPITVDERDRRRAANRKMLRWAVAQYDDRPMLRKLFVPCRFHAYCKKAIKSKKIRGPNAPGKAANSNTQRRNQKIDCTIIQI